MTSAYYSYRLRRVLWRVRRAAGDGEKPTINRRSLPTGYWTRVSGCRRVSRRGDSST